MFARLAVEVLSGEGSWGWLKSRLLGIKVTPTMWRILAASALSSPSWLSLDVLAMLVSG